MRRGVGKAGIVILTMTFAMGLMSMETLAAETQAEEIEVSMDAGSIINGTLGDNNGILWSYDTSTKTLTVTGEDSGIYYNGSLDDPYSPFYAQCSDVESIIIKDCKIKGTMTGLFGKLRQLKSVKFENFDTSEVTHMSSMFYECFKLEELDLSDFDV